MKQWLLVVAFTLFGIARAQTTPPATPTPPSSGICFVTSKRVLEAHPDGVKVLEARKRAEEELKPLQQQIVALQQKIAAGNATAAERQQYEALVKSYQTQTKAIQDAQNKLLEPITKAVDAIIARVAPSRGCTVVLDRAIAASSGLVVYADPNTDITDAVIAELRKPA
jgi:outer membrane protein